MKKTFIVSHIQVMSMFLITLFIAFSHIRIILSQQIRLTLLQLPEDRYGKKSLVITSQLPVAKWYEYINDPTLADAIMDRMPAVLN